MMEVECSTECKIGGLIDCFNLIDMDKMTLGSR